MNSKLLVITVKYLLATKLFLSTRFLICVENVKEKSFKGININVSCEYNSHNVNRSFLHPQVIP